MQPTINNNSIRLTDLNIPEVQYKDTTIDNLRIELNQIRQDTIGTRLTRVAKENIF